MSSHPSFPERAVVGAWHVGAAIAIVLAIVAATAGRARAASSRWAAVYGGGGAEEVEAIRETSDGGFVVAGFTDSFGDSANGDAWILKLDATGAVVWQNAYGGAGEDMLVDIRETADGGTIAAGWTESFGAAKSDVWVVKLDSAGVIEWQKRYGGAGKEQAWSVEITSDGHYLIAGGTTSFGAGRADYWVLKLDTAGEIVWQKTYGGARNDGGGGAFEEFVVRALEGSDGNYVIASESSSFGSGVTDIWVVKIDPNGDVLWQAAYGGFDEDTMWSFAVTADGGYVVPGSTVSFSPDFSGDMWVLKLDAAGAIQWQKILAIPGQWDEVLSVGATTDGGALLGGFLDEGAADWDLLLVRLDASGGLLWAKRFEYGFDWPNAIVETSDGGFAVAGVGWPQPADLELLVLRLDPDGMIEPTCGALSDLAIDEVASGAVAVSTNASVVMTTAAPIATNAAVTPTSATPAFLCLGEPIELCDNGTDDDGDGLVDCADPDCTADSDGDGFVGAPCGGDCDDRDAAVHPGAVEACVNGIDDDCDGAADCDDPACAPTADVDGDGYPAGPCGSDCDDSDPNVNPGVAEICTNGIDDQCDGATDCTDAACVELPACAVSASYARGRSLLKLNPTKPQRDAARFRVCVSDAVCEALAGAVGDATAQISIGVDDCAPVEISADRLVANASSTVFRAKTFPGELPRYVLKVACKKRRATFKLVRTGLASCATNPISLSLAVPATNTLVADEIFEEITDAAGNLRKLRYASLIDCTG